ncbi:MAG TPA: outer membrane beta-barrel protein [Ignavibacteriaceae bacterium]|nr:outer membrane beta-barrel protein [Ignavibacteriaceae bacterium]
MKNVILIAVLLIISSSEVFPQETNENSLIEKFLMNTKLITTMDVYYSYDFATNQNPKANERRLAGSAPFNNEFRLNYFSFEMQHNSNKLRFAGGLHFGDVPQLRTPVEKQVIRTIKKAYFGYKTGENSWLDFGYIGSPFGFESIGIDNWFTNTSIASFCQPGNILGIRYQSVFSEELSYQISLHNSYNVLSANNTNKSLGLSLQYKPSKKLTINYTNEVGDEGENYGKSYFNIFNNLVLTFIPTDFLTIIAQIDYSMQANSKKNSPDKPASFYSGLIAFRLSVTERLKLSIMGDMINDPDGFITGGIYQTNNGLKTYAITTGLHYFLLDEASIKLEYQYTEADQDIFIREGKRRNNFTFSTNVKLSSK